MIILKVKEKGTVIDIPGTKKARSPADIDITKVNINFVTMYLRKQGIKNYEIISTMGEKQALPSSPKKRRAKKENFESRFNKLESLIVNLLGRKQSTPQPNSEQITNKLKKLEKLSEEIIRKQSSGVPVSTKSDEPVIEELDDMFIPEIDIGGMSVKGSTTKTLQSDSDEAGETADLLSSIVKNGG
jgi:hypothetical protein